MSPKPIVVGVDGSASSELALHWALDGAVVLGAPVHVICCHRRRVTLGWEGVPAIELERLDLGAQRFAHEVVEQVLGLARGVAPEVRVTGEVIEGHAAQVLTGRSTEAARVVIGSRQVKALGSALLGSVGASVAAGARCPVVVVRGPAGLAAEHPTVVVGVDGSDATEPALRFGFERASRHDVPLRAVLCWWPDPLASMQRRCEAAVAEHAQSWLTETVDAWKRRYPTVTATGAVVRDHPVVGLVTASAAQHLLVVRSRTRSAPGGTLLGSVTRGVLHHAICPVAVIPAALA